MHHQHDIDIQAELELTRRSFLNTAASGLGGIALASLLQQDGLLAAPAAPNPLAPKSPHFPGKAKNCIFFFKVIGSMVAKLSAVLKLKKYSTPV